MKVPSGVDVAVFRMVQEVVEQRFEGGIRTLGLAGNELARAHMQGADGAGARLLGIRLLDHLIVGDAGRYYSFREAGALSSAIDRP